MVQFHGAESPKYFGRLSDVAQPVGNTVAASARTVAALRNEGMMKRYNVLY